MSDVSRTNAASSVLSPQSSVLPESSVLSPQSFSFVHVVPLWLLVAVWAALMVGTFATVAVVGIDLGKLNLWLAMAIATAKASLVALYFMHLRYDRPFLAIVFVTSLVFVMLFVGLALMDTVEYQPELIPGFAPALDRV